MQRFNSILLIDDDEISNFLCEETIKSSGITDSVVSFSDADEALDYLSKNIMTNPPDVIFLDINMPGMDGWEFLEDLHKLQGSSLKRSKVIILSSSKFHVDIERSKEFLEVEGYVAKPLTTSILISLTEKYFQNNLSQSTCS